MGTCKIRLEEILKLKTESAEQVNLYKIIKSVFWAIKLFELKSLIMAQIERWRQA